MRILTLRNAYLYTGDKELVKENYPTLQKYEEYLHSTLVNGLLSYDFYNDWLALELIFFHAGSRCMLR